MQLFQIIPDLLTFNLVVRSVHDTSFGKYTLQECLSEGINQDSIQIDDN